MLVTVIKYENTKTTPKRSPQNWPSLSDNGDKELLYSDKELLLFIT